ncbi:MAG: STAS domain-containing protein [Desulfovibrionales bacterium]
MKMTVHETSDTLHIVLEGDLTIEKGSELRDRFIESLERVKNIELNLSGAGSTDISFWQLVSAVGKTAEAMGLRFTLSSALPEHAQRFLGNCGMDQTDYFGILEEPGL